MSNQNEKTPAVVLFYKYHTFDRSFSSFETTTFFGTKPLPLTLIFESNDKYSTTKTTNDYAHSPHQFQFPEFESEELSSILNLEWVVDFHRRYPQHQLIRAEPGKVKNINENVTLYKSKWI